MQMNNTKLLIGYCRISMEDTESIGESDSIMNQRLLIKSFISSNPELSSLRYEEIYDDGYSGSTLERPGMQTLLEKVRNEEVACIVVKDFSRFSRNYIDMGTYLEQIFPFMGVRFISVTDNFDSKNCQNTSSMIDVGFKSLLADFYRNDTSVKVKNAMDAKKAKGEYCMGSAPFGYAKDPDNKNTLVIVDDEAAVIRRIFQMALEKMNRRQIADKLNEDGILTPIEFMSKRQKVNRKHLEKGRLYWHSDTIRKIIDNEVYMGCMVYGKTKIIEAGSGKEINVPKEEWKIIEGHHPAIISREDYLKVQQMRPKANRSYLPKPRNIILKGKVYCGGCGCIMQADKLRDDRYYYRCAYRKYGSDNQCFSAKIDNRILENVVLNELKWEIRNRKEQEKIQEEVNMQHQNKLNKLVIEKNKVQNDMKHIFHNKQEYLEKYHEELISREEFVRLKEEIANRLEKLEKQNDEINALIEKEKEFLNNKHEMDYQLMEYLGLERLTCEIVERYVEAVHVHDSGKIEIQWKFEQ